MPLDPNRLAATLSRETGFPFDGRAVSSAGGERILIFTPADHDERETFSIVARLRFRRLELEFSPGRFARELLDIMPKAEPAARELFISVLKDCEAQGAEIWVTANDVRIDPADEMLWQQAWRRFSVRLRRAKIEIGAASGNDDEQLMLPWLLRLTAAVTSLLPLEQTEDSLNEGLPEGAISRVEVNRYERDRRNRAAALAIHGYSCAACGMNFEDHYGSIAAGYIEIHHLTPISQLTPGYHVNPKTDLVPLCANCHAVAHRRNPPLSVEEISAAVASSRNARNS